MKKIFKYINDIDILDVNYSDTYFKKNIYKKNIFIIIIKNVINTIHFTLSAIVLDLFFFFENSSLKNKNLFFYGSINQYNALNSIGENVADSLFIGVSRTSENRLYMSLGCLFSFVLLPIFSYKFLSFSKKYKRKILENFSNYFFILGMLFWWTILLKILNVKSIFFSNDHLVYHRILRMAAQINKIPTIYIQHASVTKKFPKLEFDISLLEGRDSYHKYSFFKNNSIIRLIGTPKFDKFFKKINQSKKIRSIGICTNILDMETDIENVCRSLFCFFGSELEIFIRPHPRDTRCNFYDRISKAYQIKLSNSKKESSFGFLSNVDLIIAGDSGIHLEAVLMNVYSIYYSAENKDYYGFLKNNLVTDYFDIDSTNNLCKRIKKISNDKPDVRSRAKYYVDTVETAYDGKSTEFAVGIIDEYILKKNLLIKTLE